MEITDLEYKIEMDVTILPSGADSYIYLQPNGLSTNLYSSNRFAASTSGSGISILNYTYIRIACAFFAKNSYAQSEVNIKALSGIIRRVKVRHQCVNSDLSHVVGEDSDGYWNDTADNITSLLLKCDTTFYGTVNVYKRIPL